MLVLTNLKSGYTDIHIPFEKREIIIINCISFCHTRIQNQGTDDIKKQISDIRSCFDGKDG